MFAPVGLAAAYILGLFAGPYVEGLVAKDRRWFRRGRPKERLVAALPGLLLLSFLVFPMVRQIQP